MGIPDEVIRKRSISNRRGNDAGPLAVAIFPPLIPPDLDVDVQGTCYQGLALESCNPRISAWNSGMNVSFVWVRQEPSPMAALEICGVCGV